MILLIDNYDSFTTTWRSIWGNGAEVRVAQRCDYP
jgi:anthranilate/para-aminobenzoate synthase component II